MGYLFAMTSLLMNGVCKLMVRGGGRCNHSRRRADRMAFGDDALKETKYHKT